MVKIYPKPKIKIRSDYVNTQEVLNKIQANMDKKNINNFDFLYDDNLSIDKKREIFKQILENIF